jgi:hypothetical protein
MKEYGQALNPNFDLTKYDIPTALICGSLDRLSNPDDDKILNDQISKNVVF